MKKNLVANLQIKECQNFLHVQVHCVLIQMKNNRQIITGKSKACFSCLTHPPFLRLASNALTDLGSVGMIFNYNEPQTQKSGAVWN